MCPDCGKPADGDATIKSRDGWQTWAYCSQDRTKWLIISGNVPSEIESEGDYAASAAMLEGFREVEPLAPS
jgi:hypothetical protein